MKSDPVISDIRKIRHRISAACGHDPKRLQAHYLKLDKKLRKSGKFRFLNEQDAALSATTAK